MNHGRGIDLEDTRRDLMTYCCQKKRIYSTKKKRIHYQNIM